MNRLRSSCLAAASVSVMRAGLAIVATLASTLCVAAAAANRPSLSVSPATVRAGQMVRITGSANGCAIGDTVFVLSRAFAPTHQFAGVPAALAKVRPGGGFHAATRIPRSRRPGRYVVTARCGGGNLGVSARLTVKT